MTVWLEDGIVFALKEVMMAGRKIRDAADALACLSAVDAAKDLSLAEWTRLHGIDGRSLNLWRVNLGRRGRTRRARQPARLIELVADAAAAAPAKASRYTLRCGDVSLELDEHFDPVTVRRLLEVLTAC